MGKHGLILLLCMGVAACTGAKTGAVAPPVRTSGNSGLIGPAAASGDPNGWQHFSGSVPRRVACGELPILLEGSHTGVTLVGNCGYVRVAGDHNDVTVELAPGGTIEITGEHNDVAWRQPNPSVPPSLLNRGKSNSFHPPAPA